ILLLEVCYRWYIVDFYGANLRRLNKEELTSKSDLPSILVIGDSFSADQHGYVRTLRDSITSHRVINAAVPGTGVRQHRRFFKRRIKEFQPDLLIYQLYVGNDLLDYRHPTGSSNLSWQRKIYWWLADRLLVLGYINAQLPALRHQFTSYEEVTPDAKGVEKFSVSNYNSRTKLLLRAEPTLLEHSILLKDERAADMHGLSQELEQMLVEVPESTEVRLLIMPHCIQLGSPYLERMLELGAEIDTPDEVITDKFLFFKFLQKSLSSERIQVYSALPWLVAADSTAMLYYANDPHLSPIGQQVVANSLLDSLRLQLD
ncbi:MAG: hypothetical protein AAFO02_17610, partial [Bacteroidota bacterium]